MKFKLNENNTKLILKESTREEYNQLKRYLNPYVKGYRFMPKFTMGGWDGKYDFFNNGYIDFGLWYEVYNICKKYSYPFQIINKEQFSRDDEINREDVENFCKEFYKDHKQKSGEPFFPYPHQIDAMYKVLKHRYGGIKVATSGGKSLIFATVLFYLLKKNSNIKVLLIVPSILLVTQFYDEVMDYNLGFDKENKNPLEIRIQEIMSDKPRKNRDGEPNLYIGTYQSLINYGTPELFPDFYKQFETICIDECLHPNTLISMADGTKKKIKNIKKGDLVYTWNELLNKKEIKEVDFVYKNLSKDEKMYEIELENGDKIGITGNHKVKLKNGKWKRIDKINKNDDILDFFI